MPDAQGLPVGLMMEDLMRLMIICILGATVFAAPCVYDVSSREPSPLASLVAAASAASSDQ
ncbi:hypothetical protein NXC14_CH02564 [Rhizobium sp. NXC14]|nr:hypothetical protein NXC14_CH02564 [Rhizobium sp. NXC14]